MKPIDPVILVHGTFAGPREGVVQWYQPGSEFCLALDRALAQRGLSARCWSLGGDPTQYFHWGPGDNTWLARSEAAQRLREFLKQQSEPCHIVAHSHGGNVVLEALGWDGGTPDGWFSGTVTLLGTPILQSRKHRRSYAGVFWVALTIAVLARVYHAENLHLWHGLVVVGVLAGLLAIRAARQFSVLGDDFTLRLTVPDPMLLLINSKQDEAYRLLASVAQSLNPLLPYSRVRFTDRLAALGAGVRHCWTIAKESCRIRKGHVDPVVNALLIVLVIATFALYAPAPSLSILAYWTVAGTLATLAVLSLTSQSAIDGLTYAQYVGSVCVVFGMKLAKYPFSLMMTDVAKRLAWPLLQAYALGLVDSPEPRASVRVEVKPTALATAQFEELPDDLVEAVVEGRNQSAKREVARFIDSVSAGNWTVDAVQQCLAQLNEPGLVHSCYYGRLDDGRVVDRIASHIQQFANATAKLEADFEREVMSDLYGDRD